MKDKPIYIRIRTEILSQIINDDMMDLLKN